jgi:hypothetical protein
MTVTMEVLPRPTPEERHDTLVEVPVDERLTELVEIIEDWVANRPQWEFTLHEGHDFGRPNNVEGRLVLAEGEHSSSVSFRLLQLDAVQDIVEELVIRFEEEKDGITKAVRLRSNGIHVELFHILTFT